MQQKESKDRLEVMLDMETCDTAETAAILEIALIPFMLDGSSVNESIIHHTIDLTSCFMAGMTFSKETQLWWNTSQQTSRARANLIINEKKSIGNSFQEIESWFNQLNETYDVHLWCRGLNFDIPKFERCFRRLLGLKNMPYRWWNLEDARTYCRAFNVHSTDIEFDGTPHSALDDCRHQIKLVQQAFSVRTNLFPMP